jgi:hypothetical protein
VSARPATPDRTRATGAARRRLVAALTVSLTLATFAPRAHGEEAEDPEEERNGTNPAPNRLLSGFAAMTRPVGMAEANVAILTLPGAEVCVERSAGCKQGDVVFALEGWEFYRWSPRWAFGAGVMLGLLPTARPRQPPEAIPRDHTRSYLTFEGMLRYYPYVGEDFEAWVGPFGGLVVVSDRFQVIDGTDDRALLGARGVTVRTEGGSFGLGAGMAHSLGEHWSLLAGLRFSQWFLRWTPAKDPLGSEASLTGRNSAISLGIGVAYRAQL